MTQYIKFWLAKEFVEVALPILAIVAFIAIVVGILIVREEFRKFCHRRAKAKVQP